MEAVVALIGGMSTVLVAWFTSRHSKATAASVGGQNGRGTVQGQLHRMEDKLDDLAVWQAQHLDRWHQ